MRFSGHRGRTRASAPSCLLALVLACPLLGIAACRSPEHRRVVEFSGPTMGTTWSVKVVTGPGGLRGDERGVIDRQIRDVLARINMLMSTWAPDSELSRFNRTTSLEPFPISAETAEVFRWSLEIAEMTGGAFDVTVSPLVEAWGFGAASEATGPPDADALARVRDITGVRHVELDPGGRWIRKRRAEVQCDVSALAPGYAADRVAALVRNRGFMDYLVDIGGELVARGRNDKGQLWQVAVERPLPQGRVIERVVPLADAAIATSGDYRNYREVNGERIAHILDPRSGFPVRHRLTSATVVDALGVRADALATALMVLGPEDGKTLARRLDLAALLLVRNAAGEVDHWMSPRFEALMRTR